MVAGGVRGAVPQAVRGLQEHPLAGQALGEGVVDLAGQPFAFGEGARAALGGGEVAAGADQVGDEGVAAGRLALHDDVDGGGHGGDGRGREQEVGVRPAREAQLGRHRERGQQRHQRDRGARREGAQAGVEEGHGAPGEARCQDHQQRPGRHHQAEPGQPARAGTRAEGRAEHVQHRQQHGEADDPGGAGTFGVPGEVAGEGGGQQHEERRVHDDGEGTGVVALGRGHGWLLPHPTPPHHRAELGKHPPLFPGPGYRGSSDRMTPETTGPSRGSHRIRAEDRNGSRSAPGCRYRRVLVMPSRKKPSRRTRVLVGGAVLAVAGAGAAEKDGRQVSVAVVDRNGNALVTLRGDGAGPQSYESAERKAFTAVSWNAPTSELAKRLEQVPNLKDIPGTLFLGGGAPVSDHGAPVAGIGVAGAPSGDLDERYAQAGAAVLGR